MTTHATATQSAPTETETPHVEPDHSTPRHSRTEGARRHRPPSDVGACSAGKPGLLLALTSGLLAALILNLVVFDDLRTDASADLVGTFLAPQHLSSILAGVLAVVLLALRHRWAPRVALTVAWIEIVAFLFFHGIPVEIGPSKPYWGDGMADTLQWFGFALILAFSASVVRVARPRTSRAIRPLTA